MQIKTLKISIHVNDQMKREKTIRYNVERRKSAFYFLKGPPR